MYGTAIRSGVGAAHAVTIPNEYLPEDLFVSFYAI